VVSNWLNALKEHGISNPWQLTEFDQWSNDAQRQDINELLDKMGEEGIVGLKLNENEWIPGARLRDVCNFGVDFVFAAAQRPKVEKLIRKLKEKKYSKLLEKLSNIALENCMWV